MIVVLNPGLGLNLFMTSTVDSRYLEVEGTR